MKMPLLPALRRPRLPEQTGLAGAGGAAGGTTGFGRSFGTGQESLSLWIQISR